MEIDSRDEGSVSTVGGVLEDVDEAQPQPKRVGNLNMVVEKLGRGERKQG